jgi:hypothetical protein
MDFKDQIKQLAERIAKLKESIATEEATKNAFIMPMIQILGYDVFNPLEVVPEFTADVGIKKGEKIDYAILREGKPLILIECKHWKQNINLHEGQLVRYFQAANARFGVLTNGIEYRFFTDLSKPNMMDERPFFEFSVTEMKENEIEELKKFHKSYFDLANIVNTASELKYTAEIKNLIQKEIADPSEWFVRGLAKIAYDGMVTSKVLEQFTALTKKSFTQVISDMIAGRLKNALREEQTAAETPAPAVSPEEAAAAEEENRIVTTQEELEGYYAVRAVLRGAVDLKRVVYRDTVTYFGILLDDNNRKTICRLHFNGTRKYIETFDDMKKGTKHEISSIDDIFNYGDLLIKTIENYDNRKNNPAPAVPTHANTESSEKGDHHG